MRARLRVFGCTVLTVTLDSTQWVVETEPDEDAPSGITGGSSLYTERDCNPPNPSGEQPY